jgi:hypothetical protein
MEKFLGISAHKLKTNEGILAGTHQGSSLVNRHGPTPKSFRKFNVINSISWYQFIRRIQFSKGLTKVRSQKEKKDGKISWHASRVALNISTSKLTTKEGTWEGTHQGSSLVNRHGPTLVLFATLWNTLDFLFKYSWTNTTILMMLVSEGHKAKKKKKKLHDPIQANVLKNGPTSGTPRLSTASNCATFLRSVYQASKHSKDTY